MAMTQNQADARVRWIEAAKRRQQDETAAAIIRKINARISRKK